MHFAHHSGGPVLSQLSRWEDSRIFPLEFSERLPGNHSLRRSCLWRKLLFKITTVWRDLFTALEGMSWALPPYTSILSFSTTGMVGPPRSQMGACDVSPCGWPEAALRRAGLPCSSFHVDKWEWMSARSGPLCCLLLSWGDSPALRATDRITDPHIFRNQVKKYGFKPAMTLFIEVKLSWT